MQAAGQRRKPNCRKAACANLLSLEGPRPGWPSPGRLHHAATTASVSPKLLEVYAEDGMTLDQPMAFTVSGDWERQEQVWERLAASYSREPYVIRRLLTEGAVRASDKRARFIGIPAYERA